MQLGIGPESTVELEWVAERRFNDAESGLPVIARISKPSLASRRSLPQGRVLEEWSCTCEIVGPGERHEVREARVYGDSLAALLLCIQTARYMLRESGIRLVYLGQESTDIPAFVPQGFGPHDEWIEGQMEGIQDRLARRLCGGSGEE